MTGFDYSRIEDTARDLYIQALTTLPPDVRASLETAFAAENSETARSVIDTMRRNVEVADRKHALICQDTGLPIYFVRIGDGFPWNGAAIKRCLYEGSKRATEEFPFRSSSTHPLTRVNPQTSVGTGLPVIHFDFVEDSENLEIVMMPKGSGSENMSAMHMFVPADGVEALKRFVLEKVVEAGGNPCGPGIVGVGIGGTADLVGWLAKEALIRPVGQRNPDPEIAAIEEELEAAINETGIGPMGLGGTVSVLAVHIEAAYTHITLNPVAVNFQCWPARRARAVISPNGDIEMGY